MMSIAAVVARKRLPLFARLSFLLLAVAGLILPAAAQVTFSSLQRTLNQTIAAPEGVAVDAAGNVYVSDTNTNSVYEIVAVNGVIPAGNATVKMLAAGFTSPYGLAVDASGDVYVADTVAVKEILAVNGVIPASPTVVSLGSGFSYPIGVAVDGSGNVYVADFSTVTEMLAVGGSVPTATAPVMVTLASSANGFSSPAGVAVDGNGNVYVADGGGGLVGEILAVNGSIPASPTTRVLASGFGYPQGVAVDPAGNVYVAAGSALDEIVAVNGSIPFGSPTILSLGTGFSATFGVAANGVGNVVADILGNGVYQVSTVSVAFAGTAIGSASAAQTLSFSIASGTVVGSVAILTGGAANKDFADAGSSTCVTGTYGSTTACSVNVKFTPQFAGLRQGSVVFFDGSGVQLASVPLSGVGNGPQIAYSPAVQSAVNSSFTVPQNIAVDGSGNLYIADSSTNTVTELTAANGYTTANPLGGGFTFNSPFGVAVDGTGNVYVGDTNNQAVEEIPVGCTQASCVVSLGGGFNGPKGLAVDSAGDVFLADGNNVKEIPVGCTAASCVFTLGTGLLNPYDVALDQSGNIFVSDSNNSAIKEIPAAGGYANTITLNGNFGYPGGLAVDSNENVYVADGALYELTAASGYSTVNQVPGAFTDSNGVAIDAKGNFYVVDAGQDLIDKLDASDAPSISFNPTAEGSTSADSPKTVSIVNFGNQRLIFSAVMYPTDFPFATGDNNACTTSVDLQGGQQCDLPISFAPRSLGPLNGSVAIVDNALNVVGSEQFVSASGTGQPGAAATLTISGSTTAVAGSSISVAVKALDSFGNTATGYTGIVQFSSSDPLASLPGSVALTNGVGSFPVTFATAGAETVTVTDTVNGSLTFTLNVAVSAGPATSLKVSVPSTALAGTPFNLTLTAYDAYLNVATSYLGTVAFTSSDARAALPAPSTLTLGTGVFSATLFAVGSQTITATDSADGLAITSVGIADSLANLVVTSTADDAGLASNCTPQAAAGTGTDTACTLRDALTYAGSTGVANISFDGTAFAAPQTITLSNGTLTVPNYATITGPTSGSGATLANLVTVDGGGASNNSSVFTVNTSPETGASIANLNITDGFGTSGAGGGIYNSGSLTLTNANITGNAVTSAGQAGGGGIFNGVSLTVIGSTISGNSVNSTGGQAGGGAIANSVGATVSLTNSTLTGNTVTAGGNGVGGGIVNNGGQVTLTNSTISGNTTDGAAGGIFNSPGRSTLANTIVSGDTSGDASETSGTIVDNGGNQIGAAGIGLAPLANYGGATETLLPTPGSPAICGGTVANATGITGDQRGFARSTTYGGTACVDSGAVQTNYTSVQFVSSSYSGIVSAPVSPSPVVTVTENGQNTAGVPVTLAFAGTGSATGLGAVTTVAGIGAAFNNVAVSLAGASDSLSVSLPITAVGNAVQPTPLSASASLAITPATPTVTANTSQATVSLGTSVTYSATVTGVGVAPTGTVTFLANGTPIGTAPVSAGSASLAPIALPSAVYSIVASYNGDANYLATASAGLTEIVAKVTPTVVVGSSLNPAPVGTSLTFTATASGPGPTPTGTVDFYSGHTYIGQEVLAAGVAQLTLNSLPSGTGTITARYFGDTNYNGTSVGFTQVVSKLTTQGLLAASPNPAVLGTAVQITDTLNTVVTGLTPTGTVAFYVDGASQGTFALVNGVATFVANGLPVGKHTILTAYSGDTNYNGGPNTSALTVTVSKLSTTVTLNSSASPVIVGSPVTFTATLTGASPAPTGTVNFLSGSTVIGSGTIAGGVATFTTSSLTPSLYAVSASYGGDVNFNSAKSSNLSESVAKAVPAVTAGTSLSPVIIGTSFTFTATVTGPGPIPTGTVNFYSSNTLVGSQPLTSGVAALTLSSLPSNYSTITAKYTGDGNYTAASAAGFTQTINKAATQVTLSPLTETVLPGASVTVTANLASTISGLAPTGTVVFYVDNVSKGSFTIANGSAAITVPNLANGSHTFSATYGGDLNYLSATAAVATVTVAKAATTVTLISSASPVTVGTPVTFTATLTGASPAPTGTVSFLSGSTVIGSGTISGGVATYTASSLTPALYAVSASYGGDANYNSAKSNSLSESVAKAVPAVTAGTSQSPAIIGSSFTFTATVTGPGPIPTGTVNFYSTNTLVGSQPLTAGVAALTLSSLPSSNSTITAKYTGDGNYSGASAAGFTQTINKATTQVTLGSLLNPAPVGSGITFTASVTTIISGTAPTGTVAFYSGTTQIGAQTLSSGQASLTVTSLPSDSSSITAHYLGDANYNAVNSAGLTQNLTKATTQITLGALSNSVQLGATVTITATMATTVAGLTPTGNVVFYLDNVNQGAFPVVNGVATFTSSSLSVGSHNFGAQYGGDINYVSTNTPRVLTVTVSKAATSVAVTSSSPGNTSNAGDSVTFTAAVNEAAAGIVPGGTVNFYVDSVLAGQGTLAGGQATYTTTALASGTHTVYTTYSGDNHYTVATSPSITQTVN